MKTREGFVSNSSSTSFVIIGQRVSLDSVDLEKGEYLLVGGYGGGEGMDVAPLTAERISLLPFLQEDDFEVWRADYGIYESKCGLEIAGGTYDIKAVDASQHQVELQDMPEYYGVDRYAVYEAITDNKPIPSLILDALEERDRSVIGLYQRGEIKGLGVFEQIWEAGDD